MMKQINWSFKLLAFSNFALMALLSSTYAASGNFADVCGEHSYEHRPIQIEYEVDYTGKKIGVITYEILCSFRWHLAKFYNTEVSKKNANKKYYVLGRKIDSQGNSTGSLVERVDILNDNNLISPPTERVDVSWCSQTLEGLNRKAPWEFAVHACMLLYKRIYLAELTRRFEGGLISEQAYRTEARLFARDGSRDVDWQPKTYEYKLDFHDYSLFGVKWVVKNSDHL